MSDEQLTRILSQLADHENRLHKLEGPTPPTFAPLGGDKQKTLREIIKGKKLNNGQEKIAAIVGYAEKISGKLVTKKEIGKIWVDTKFDGTYKTNLVDDASGTYVRVHSNGECDLTQTGEDFFEKLLKNEPSNPTSK